MSKIDELIDMWLYEDLLYYEKTDKYSSMSKMNIKFREANQVAESHVARDKNIDNANVYSKVWYKTKMSINMLTREIVPAVAESLPWIL